VVQRNISEQCNMANMCPARIGALMKCLYFMSEPKNKLLKNQLAIKESAELSRLIGYEGE